MKLYYYIDRNGVLRHMSNIIEIEVEGTQDPIINSLREYEFDIDKIDEDGLIKYNTHDVNDIMRDVSDYRKGNCSHKHSYFARFLSLEKTEPNFVTVDNLRCVSPEDALETALSYSINNPRWNHIRNDRVIAEIFCGNKTVISKVITIGGEMGAW